MQIYVLKYVNYYVDHSPFSQNLRLLWQYQMHKD